MSYAAAMTWEMDGFRIVRSRPLEASRSGAAVSSGRQGFAGRGLAQQDGPKPRALPGRGAVATGAGSFGAGITDRVRGAERALELDWQIVVERCLDGDSGAWTELVKAHHRRVYALCYRFTGSTHDAEDLTQDVFLKVYGNLAAFDLTRGSFQTWITTLTRNLLVDHFRRTKQQRVTDSMDAGWNEADDRTAAARIAGQLAANGPTQHDRAAQKEIAKMVQEALTRISPELREAVILRDLQDMDYKEIAQVLRIPEGTVKSRISRGRAELAQVLERNKGQVV
ncbi:MAG: RNA polymerase sigma factor [Acidobacteriaceae bacterium]